MNTFEQFQWPIFIGILIAGVLLSGVLGCFKSKSTPYLLRFLTINILLHIAFLIFISFHSILAVFNSKTEYESLSKKYKMKAEYDIKSDLISYETFGFPMPLDSAAQVEEGEVDSLIRTYGIVYTNIGCLITGPLLKAQSDYELLTESYLDQRNGIGWKHKMNEQIAEIRNN